jgi:hypothetical protein
MRKIILLLLLVLTGLVALGACQLAAHDETIEFELPLWPEYLPELQGWEVDDASYSPQTKTISLRVDKNRPCCIIATPVTQNQFFKPAGTIYPYSTSITWSGGYAAMLYKTISTAANQSGYTADYIEDYLSSFNWGKLLETLEQKQADAAAATEDSASPFYNPWLLNTQEVLEGIAYKNFSATKLKLTQTVIVPLDFQVFSSYIPENEFMNQKKQPYVTVKLNAPQLFALRLGSGTTDATYALLISASSAKNISLEFISMPILKEELWRNFLM